VSRDFCFWFFHESVSPQPQSIPDRFIFFRTFAEIFASQGATLHGIINDTIDTGGKFATSSASFVGTGGKFATGVNDMKNS
jgi:hypothetical protein